MQMNEIIVTYGDNPEQMAFQLLEKANLASMIPSKDASIILKPNLVVPVTPEGGGTTHPAIVIATIEYLQNNGFSNITIAESAWVGASTEEGFAVNGYPEISRKYHVPLVDVKQDTYEKRESHGITMELSKTILDCDFLISLPVLKGHCQMAMTCALKNMKGTLSDRSKRMFHALGLAKPIAALNAVKHADFILVDSLNGDLDFEEGGNPVKTDRMFACTDSVLCDSYGTSLMGFTLNEVPYIKIAESYGVGSSDLRKATITTLSSPKTTSNAHPAGLARFLSQHTLPKEACSACYGNLIHALKRLDEAGELDQLKKKICIGQGYKRDTDPKETGVGSCTRGLGCSLTGCPPSARDMVDFLKEQLQ